jgi:hypothetical protein
LFEIVDNSCLEDNFPLLFISPNLPHQLIPLLPIVCELAFVINIGQILVDVEQQSLFTVMTSGILNRDINNFHLKASKAQICKTLYLGIRKKLRKKTHM